MPHVAAGVSRLRSGRCHTHGIHPESLLDCRARNSGAAGKVLPFGRLLARLAGMAFVVGGAWLLLRSGQFR